MKGSSKNSQLDEMVRAARGDVPPAGFVDEMRTLALLTGGADGLGPLSGAESSLAPGAGASGTVLLGGGVVKLVIGGIASVVLAGGLWVSGQLGTSGALLPGVGASRESAGHVELAPKGAHEVSSGEGLVSRGALEGAAPLGDGAGEGLEGADGSATLPLPPVFGSERRETSAGNGSRIAAVEKSRPRAEPSVSPSRGERVLAEARLVDQARRALRSDAALALSLTEQGAREFPSGAAATERSVIAIEALVKLGRLNEARARFESFERAYPNSFHLPYLRRMLGEN